MKECINCNIVKEYDCFYFKKATFKYDNQCKECIKNKRHEYYLLNKEEIYQNNIIKRIFLAEEINKTKNHPCIDCGKQYEPFCMDYDHLSDKIMTISKMIHETFSLKNILKEIEKCELICVLCHRTRTFNRKRSKGIKTYYPCYYRNLKILLDVKNKPCEICDIQYEFWQMEFDHLDHENKTYEVGHLLLSSQKKLENEIKKCQILCSLCHRRKTKRDFWD